MTRTYNIGEGIAIVGILLAVAILRNYWLLFFMVIPMWSWQRPDIIINNEYEREQHQLNMEKLRHEIRLLKKEIYKK